MTHEERTRESGARFLHPPRVLHWFMHWFMHWSRSGRTVSSGSSSVLSRFRSGSLLGWFWTESVQVESEPLRFEVLMVSTAPKLSNIPNNP